MRRYGLFVFVLFCCSAVFGQDDSSRLDVGYLALHRDFTQTIVIKGADLEKMPFANLSEAISAWAYGAYTPAMVQYIVDGNPVSDVNAYSIYEIDEIVLLGNAAALAGTGGGQQEVVLIRTKRGAGPKGLTVAAQGGPVNANNNGVSTDTRFFQQYYISGWRNLDKISVGVSANYLRDVMPIGVSEGSISTPYNLQRWRLNGYFTWRPDSHNQIDLSLNYTPQRMALALDTTQETTGTIYQYSGTATQHLLTPRLSWRSRFASGWTNELLGTYLTGAYHVNDLQQFSSTNSATTGYSYGGLGKALDFDKSSHLWVRDRVAFSAKAGSWRIEPALNVSYEHLSEQYAFASLFYTYNSFSGPLDPASYPLVPADSPKVTYDEIFLTPAVDFSFRKTLDVVGGVLVDASKQQIYNGRRGFPYGTVTLDLLQLAGAGSVSSLKLFGSYAQTTLQSINGYALSDLSRGLDVSTGLPMPLVFSPLVNSPVLPYQGTYHYLPVPAYWVWQTGAAYSGWGNRLQISYWLERRNFTTAGMGYTVVTNGGLTYSYPTITEPEWRSTLHHADIRVMVLQAKTVSWQTGVNLTLLRCKVDSAGSVQIGLNGIGDTYPHPFSTTGGWVNRVQVAHFTGGVDLLCRFGETVYNTNGTIRRVNSVVVPNLYVGYRCGLELFVSTRGLVRNSSADVMDGRRYYTVGGKVGL